jgi:Meiotically Up-regulated Gene 113 (MUG113) protein
MNAEIIPFAFDNHQVRTVTRATASRSASSPIKLDADTPIKEPINVGGYLVDGALPIPPLVQVFFRYFAATPAEREKKETSVALYLIKAAATRLIKIGVSTQVEQRLKALETANGSALILLKVWNCFSIRYRASRVENLLHNSFRQFRQQGEWFDLPESVLNKLLAVSDPEGFSQFATGQLWLFTFTGVAS